MISIVDRGFFYNLEPLKWGIFVPTQRRKQPNFPGGHPLKLTSNEPTKLPQGHWPAGRIMEFSEAPASTSFIHPGFVVTNQHDYMYIYIPEPPFGTQKCVPLFFRSSIRNVYGSSPWKKMCSRYFLLQHGMVQKDNIANNPTQVPSIIEHM